MSKKVLSIALAITMLVSLFAFSVSAACGTGKEIGFCVECDDDLVPDTDIAVKVYVQVPASTDLTAYKLGQINYAIMFDSSVFELPGKSNRTWNDTAVPMMQSTSNVNAAAVVFNSFSSSLSTADAALYNACCMVQTGAYDSSIHDCAGDAVTTAKGYHIPSLKTLMFTLNMHVKDTCTATSTQLGIISTPYTAKPTNFFAKTHGTSGGTSAAIAVDKIDFSEAIITVSSGATLPEVNYTKMMVKANGTEKMDAALIADLVNFASEAYETSGTSALGNPECSKISEIGFVYSKTVATPTATLDGVVKAGTDCTKVPSYTIYTSSGYKFRSVIENVPRTGADTIYAIPYIVVDGVLYVDDVVTTITTADFNSAATRIA